MKKILILLLVVAMAICSAMAIACKNDDETGETKNLSLNKYTLQLVVGQSETLICTVDGGGSCVWNTSDSSVASVDGGMVVALKVGTAEISASAQGETVYCSVTVVSANISNSNFTIDKKTATIFKGHSLTVKPALIFGSDYVEVDASKVVWTSSNTEIATVAGGVVTGVGAGNVTITAEYEYNGVTLSATSEFTVKELLFVEFEENYSITLASTKTISGKTNDKNVSAAIEYKVFDNNENDVTASFNKSDIKFASLNTGVATVDASGVVTAVAAGKTVISVECQGATSAVDVNVMTAVSEKADLDKIAFAYKNSEVDLWAKDYIFTNDIDYNGEVIVPIAPMNEDIRNWKWSNKNWGVLNNDSKPGTFSGTIDGNGYAVKNAKLSANCLTGASKSLMGVFIGSLTGTLKNLAFTNLLTENPADVDTWADGIDWSSMSSYVMFLSGLVYYVNGGTVENIYVELYNGMLTNNNNFGAIACSFSSTATIKNCIAKLENVSTSVHGINSWYKYGGGAGAAESNVGMFGKYNANVIQNCFLINSETTQKSSFVTYQSVSEANDAYNFNIGRRYTSYSALNDAKASVLATYGGAWNYESGVLKLGNNVIG